MSLFKNLLAIAGIIAALPPLAVSAHQNNNHSRVVRNVQLGPRPYFLIEDMQKSELKAALN